MPILNIYALVLQMLFRKFGSPFDVVPNNFLFYNLIKKSNKIESESILSKIYLHFFNVIFPELLVKILFVEK